MKVIIVGGVAGGASCAARLRRLDEKAEILMVERGPYVSYANCGLPYHVGGSIEQESSLLVATEQMFREMFAIDCRTRCEVVGISAAQKTVELKNHATGEVTTEKYDKLVLSPGAAPIRPPLPGIDLPGIFSVRTVPDARNIRQWLDREDKEDRSGLDKYTAFQTVTKPRRAVVVGGGFIGLEMVENLVHRGLEVTLIEKLNQVMPPLDPEMACLVERYMVKHGVRLELNDGVAGFQQSSDGSLEVLTSSGKCHPADIVILAIGVRPETELAKMAGIEIGQRGGIRVDEQMRTSDPDIFAVGDAVEVKDFVTGQWTLIPLAGPANRQGRIAADVIAGRDSRYRGTQGTSICQIFEGTIAQTGVSEKVLGATWGPGFREDLPLREFARGVLSGCENARDQGPLPEIRRTTARSAGARRGWCCQADRFLCHGDPGAAYHLRPGRIRAELRAALWKRKRPRQLRGDGGSEYPPRRHAAHPLGLGGRRVSPRCAQSSGTCRRSRSGRGQYPVAATSLAAR